MLRNNQNRLQWANLPLTLFYILGGSASAGMAVKNAYKNTYNVSVPRGVSLLRNIHVIPKSLTII